MIKYKKEKNKNNKLKVTVKLDKKEEKVKDLSKYQ